MIGCLEKTKPRFRHWCVSHHHHPAALWSCPGPTLQPLRLELESSASQGTLPCLVSHAKQTNKHTKKQTNSQKSVLHRNLFHITQKVWFSMLLLLLYTVSRLSFLRRALVLRRASCVTHKSHAGKRNNPGPVAVLSAFLTISWSSPSIWQGSAESHTNCTSMKLHPVLPSHSKREMENWNFYSIATTKPGGLGSPIQPR